MSVKIVLPERGEKVRCGNGTKCILPSGEEMKGVAAIDIRIRPDKIVTATVELGYIGLEEVEGAELKIVMKHPLTDKLLNVKSIAFEDGSLWVAP